MAVYHSQSWVVKMTSFYRFTHINADFMMISLRYIRTEMGISWVSMDVDAIFNEIDMTWLVPYGLIPSADRSLN